MGHTSEITLQRMFAEQVALSPDALAVEFEDRHLSYRELDARAGAVARWLVGQGAGPDSIVALVMERSLEMVIGMFGILKAGAAYLPVAPDLPPDRVAYMLGDAAVVGILLQKGLRFTVEGVRAPVLIVDAEEPVGCDADDDALSLAPEAGSENLAYVLYTSGSTGRPKGVLITHRAIVNHMLWMQQAYPLGVEDVVLQKTPFIFDASVWEFFAPLLAGARLVMARPGGHMDPHYLVETIRSRGVTILQLVPTLLRPLLDEPGFAECRGLRRLFCGGEALTTDLVERFISLRLPASVHNLYGPTETCIDATAYDCRSGYAGEVIPIGLPIENMHAVIVDAEGNQVSPGAAGELLLGGDGLARGYLNQPELTARKFIPNHFTDIPCDRLYRTGDLVRQAPGGELEYLGRMDQQVKIRGFRIETGEVETVLHAHPAVAENAVLPARSLDGEDILVAFWVARSGSGAHTASLREHAARTLPGYMVPSRFVELETLPRLPSGKVDRKALASLPLDLERPIRGNGALVTATERSLAALWREVTASAEPGGDDRFVACGGHSLAAMRLCSRIARQWPIEIGPAEILGADSLRSLASLIDTRLSSPVAPAQGFTRADRDRPQPLSDTQELMLLHALRDPESPLYNEPVTVELRGPIDVVALEGAFRSLIRRHEILRTRYQWEDGEPCQVVEADAPLSLEVHEWVGLAAPELEERWMRVAGEAARAPFDLSRTPPLRAFLARLDHQRWRLGITFHHIATDAMTVSAVLIPDLRELYRAGVEGRAASLSPLAFQYVDYALWQRAQAAGSDGLASLEYWRRKLAGLPSFTLPGDRARPAQVSHQGARQIIRLAPELAGAVRGLCQSEGVTVFAFLLAAFKVLLHARTRERDIVVGSVSAGRDRPEVEGVAGCFLDYMVLRCEADPSARFSDFLHRVAGTVIEAIAHQSAGFGRLVSELRSSRDASTHPFYQVMFLMEPGLASMDDDWRCNQLDVFTGVSKLDLSFGMEDTGETIGGRVEFNTGIYAPETIRRLADDYIRLLESATSSPGKSLAELAGLLGSSTVVGGSEPVAQRVGAPRAALELPAANPGEGILRDLWTEVVGLAPATDADFFAQGGHSLMALRMLARLRQRLGVSLSLGEFFADPSFSALLGRLGRSEPEVCALPELEAVPRVGAMPLTAAQNRIWFNHQLDPSGIGHNIVLALRLRGDLDRGALAGAIACLVARHESLRTVFSLDDGEPVQHILDRADPRVPTLLDQTGVSAEGDERLGDPIHSALRHRFDLFDSPPFRCHLVRLSDREFLLIFALHHIIADEGLDDVLFRDLECDYQRLRSGSGEAPRDPGFHPVDFAHWERSAAAVAAVDRAAGWWREALHGSPEGLDLPCDRSRSDQVSYAGARISTSIGSSEAAALRGIAAQAGVSEFSALLFAWGACLGRWSGQEDLIVGAPVSLRGHPGLDRSIGIFINTLPFRVQWRPDLGFSGNLATFRTHVHGAMARAHVPLERIVGECRARRSAAGSLYQVMLVMKGATPSPPRLDGIEISPVPVEPESAKLDLTLFVESRADGLELELEYRSDLFDAGTVRAWLEGFAAFLRQAARDASCPISTLACLSDQDREGQLQWSAGVALPPVEPVSLCDFIAPSLASSGAMMAVTDGRVSLSYRELDTVSAALARRLVGEHGAPPRIGVCFERGCPMVAAILAVLRSGAAYVPLDPSSPPARLSWMISDAGLPVIVAGRGAAADAVRRALGEDPERLPVQILEFDGDLSDPDDHASEDLPAVPPESAAYVIYTSGSTGRPKGVLVEHRNAVSSLRARLAVYGSQPARFLLISPAVFDSSVAGLFWTLATGGTLVLPEPGLERDPRLLADFLRAEKVTHYLCLPSLHTLILDALGRESASLRTVIVAGETCPDSLPVRHRMVLPSVYLFNEYGPTECSVWSTFADLTDASAADVSIGGPIPGARVLVVDQRMRLLPRGARGELIIGGPGVARGYLNRPDLDRDRFLTLGGDGVPAGRYYRTGDLARWREDGRLEFCGRIDDQVKVRGYRIELGEIESALRELPLVAEAAALVTGCVGGDQRICAFVRLEPGGAVPRTWREDLGRRLPHYMLPSVLSDLQDFPRTANGKIDRHQLAGLASRPASAPHADADAPVDDPVLAGLLDLWRQLLGVQQIHPDDDFFALGGHSFLAVRMFGRIERAFGVSLPVATLFKASTARGLAEVIRSSGHSPSASPGFFVIREGGAHSPLFCLHPRDGGVLVYRELAANLPGDRAVIGVEAPWRSVDDEGVNTLEELAASYLPGVISQHRGNGPFHLCGFSVGGLIALELAQQLIRHGHQVGLLALLDTYNPALPPRRLGLLERWRIRLAFADESSSWRRTFLRLRFLFLTARAFSGGLHERFGALRARLRRASGRELPIDLRHFEARANILRATDLYRPADYPGRIVLFRGEDLDTGYERSPDLGWSPVAKGGLEVISIRGDHTTFMREALVAPISRTIESLASAAESTSASAQSQPEDA